MKILGFEGFDWGGLGSSNVDLSALYDEADAMDDIAESAKKASDNLQGFDKINKLADDTDKNKSSLLPSGLLDAALLDAISEYEKRWNKAFAEISICNSSILVAISHLLKQKKTIGFDTLSP